MGLKEYKIEDLLSKSGSFFADAVDNEIIVDTSGELTDVYTYKNGATTYLVITVTYSDATKTVMTGTKRTA